MRLFNRVLVHDYRIITDANTKKTKQKKTISKVTLRPNENQDWEKLLAGEWHEAL